MEHAVIKDAAPFLPGEIITSILKRLPVKSLMRFQCVCKLWKNIFKTPSFIQDHLCHSRHHNPSFLFFETCGFDPFHLHLVDCDMRVRDVLKAPLLGYSWARLVRILGSSNGLLFVVTSDGEDEVVRSPSSLLLWNPATRDVREVPKSRTMDSRKYHCSLGYGFSPFVNDYKIVSIYVANDNMVQEAEVYSLRRDSWKKIELGKFEGVTLLRAAVVSPNGTIFWNGYKLAEEGVGGVIVSFDIAMEVFTSMPLLPDFWSMKLAVYEDKPALLDFVRSFPNLNLWVMDEDIGSSRERWCWTKKVTCDPCPWIFFYGFIWRNEIVMFGLKNERKIGEGYKLQKSGLCMFNVTTKEFKILFTPEYRHYDFLDYVESLTPVVNIRNIEEA